MKKPKGDRDTLRKEYDLYSMGTPVQGKYAKAFIKASNIVALDPDVAKVFDNSSMVNETLRTFIKVSTKKYRHA